MNILLEQFPTKTIIDGKEYKFNTDFRNCLKIILAFEDEELLMEDKIWITLNNLYGNDIPENLEIAFEKAILFLDCGEKLNSTGESKESGLKLYSFEKDAKYIYSAIKQTHRIDLDTIGYMHWWKFVYLFLDLNKECFFCQMIDLRRKKKKGKLSKEERILYRNLYDILEIETKKKYTEEEQGKIEEFMSLLEQSEVK